MGTKDFSRGLKEAGIWSSFSPRNEEFTSKNQYAFVVSCVGKKTDWFSFYLTRYFQQYIGGTAQPAK